jgi:hypothetical protein
MPDLQCTSSQIQQQFQVRPLRSDLSLFTWSFEPLTHAPLNALMHCSHSQRMETQNLEALNSNNILRHWTQISRYQTSMKPLKVTASHARTNDRSLAANPSLHSFSANNILLPTAQMQCEILLTHILPPKCSLSLLHAPKSKARTPQILIIPRHRPP